jgi:glycosyltransferase involved in cell wall biosynthesis
MNHKTLNVLFTDDSMDVGGKEKLLLSALEGLDRRRIIPSLCLLRECGVLGDTGRELAEYSSVTGRKGSFSLSTCFRIRRFIKRHKIDIVHCNGVVDAFHVFVATRGIKVKLLCSIHGYEGGLHGYVHMMILAAFDAVIAVSRSFLIDLVKAGYVAKRYYYIYNCHSNTLSKRITGLCNDPMRIVSVSRFDWSKDQLTVVEACKVLNDMGKHITVDFVGGGSTCYVDPVKALVVKHGLESQVRFLGSVKEIGSLLSEYDAFILSSYAESFGIAIIEAMAAGLPVIASDIPSFREITEDGEYGILFRCGDARHLAEQISMLFSNDGLYSDYVQCSLQRSQVFSRAQYCWNLEKLYYELMDCRSHLLPASSCRRSIGEIVAYADSFLGSDGSVADSIARSGE